MWITVDFDSSEAIYMQLCNQIVEAIAVSKLQEGESLPSVRQMAEYAGINMQIIARAKCNGMSAEEIHGIVDGVISEMEDSGRL